MFGDTYDMVKVTTIEEIMKTHNHSKIDLLKLDIEGAEVKVLNNMLDNKIYPTKRAKNIIMKYWIITIRRVGDFREIYIGTIRDK